MIEQRISDLLADLLAGARDDAQSGDYDKAIAGCERMRTIMRDHFMPTTTLETLIFEIKAERDTKQLDTLWDKQQLEELKW